MNDPNARFSPAFGVELRRTRGKDSLATSLLERVYLLEAELPEDSFYSPVGVVIVGEKQRITLYCMNSSHNLYRSAITKHTWEDLEKGVIFRNTGFRISSLTEEMQNRGWSDSTAIPAILRHMQNLYPRHLYFLSNLQ